MNKIIKLLIILMLVCSANLAKSQTNDTLEIKRGKNGVIEFVRLKPDNTRRLTDGSAFLKKLLKTNPADDFILIEETTDDLGMMHRRYQQYYGKIKVDGASYSLHGRKGQIEILAGNFQAIKSATKPGLTQEQALKKALAFVGAKKYKWQDPELEKAKQQRTNDPKATYYPKGELLEARDYLNDGGKYKLAWMFMISSLLPNNEQLVYVDAVSGTIINSRSLMENTNIACTATTLYNGTVAITGDAFAGGNRLRESRNGVSIQTLNLQHNTSTAGAIDFTNNNTSWTNGSWANFTADRAALDAHWGAERVLDYWNTTHGRNSIDGSGLAVVSYVHFGNNIDNAYWVGGSGNHYMLYGDGATLPSLTALDICAHEFGHGINEFSANTAGGTSGHDEGNALNEGLSDIWGACVENASVTGKQTWLMGEDLFTTGFNCIRDLQNPKSTLAWEGQHPDTYQGQFWDNGGEPHVNSTVLTHCFFLLSQGGTGTNDFGDPFNVAGIGITDAARIVYRAERFYLGPGGTFANARTAMIQAATDLFGAGSCEEISTTNAWFAVGVGSEYITSAMTISGPSDFCTTSTNYSIINLPSGATVVWHVNPAGIATINTPTATQTTLTMVSGGYINLSATVTGNCGSVLVNAGQIQVGSPGAADIIGMEPSVYFGAGGVVYLSVDETASSYAWDIYGGTVYGSSTGQSVTVVLDNCFPNQTAMNDFDANVALVNGCGTSGNYHEHAYAECGGPVFRMTVAPNPSKNGYINVAIEGLTSSSGKVKPGLLQVKLYEINTKIAVRQWSFAGDQQRLNLNTTGLRKGYYVVEIWNGKDRISKNVLIE